MADVDGGPAFPDGFNAPGMTLRDYFAGQALAGLCADAGFKKAAKTEAETRGISTGRSLAGSAYEIADAMLAERTPPDSENDQ